MLTKIDWISFSIPMEKSDTGDERETAANIVKALDDLHEDLPQLLLMGDEFEARNGRAPYNIGWHRATDGLTVYANPYLSHALVEISGAGCDHLAQAGTLDTVLRYVMGRLTRLDIACDIATDVRPKDFAEVRNTGRFKAHSYVNSESGETFYVGAKTSDRYCRVYRYNAPHPRHNLLRVEYVIKAENARNTADAVLQQGIRSVVATLGNSFGWEHPAWVIEDESAELTVYRPERREGKTIYWLHDTIAPLLVRLHREGKLNAAEWFQEAVLSKVSD